MDVLLLREIPLAERPRERMQRLGAGALANAELLALIFGSGARGKSAVELGGEASKSGLARLARRTVREIPAMRGLGVAKACRLAAAFELGRRVEMERAAKNSPVRTASDAARIARNSLSGLQREHLKVLFLNSRNRLLGEETVFVGSLGSNAFCPREIFKAAFDRGAAAVILAHNHPSGDPSPSSEDVEATKKLALAGGLVGVQVLDHLVVGGKKVSSMRQEGLL